MDGDFWFTWWLNNLPGYELFGLKNPAQCSAPACFVAGFLLIQVELGLEGWVAPSYSC